MSISGSLKFFFTFLSKPTQVGAVAPSSDGLARAMVDGIDWENVRNVVEYGPGTGVFTEQILARMKPGTKFFAIEIDPGLVEILSKRYPQVRVYQDSVQNVRSLCEQEGIDEIDAVVCGLPWAAFSDSDQTAYLDAMMSVLRSGGQFATFAYLQGLLLPAGRRFRGQLRKHFSEVTQSKTQWLNLPPAFIYRCRK